MGELGNWTETPIQDGLRRGGRGFPLRITKPMRTAPCVEAKTIKTVDIIYFSETHCLFFEANHEETGILASTETIIKGIKKKFRLQTSSDLSSRGFQSYSEGVPPVSG